MNNLKKLVVGFCLMTLLTITALGGETESPPCAQPNPGETESPPCATVQSTADDSTTLEALQAFHAETVVITTTVEAAVGALLAFF